MTYDEELKKIENQSFREYTMKGELSYPEIIIIGVCTLGIAPMIFYLNYLGRVETFKHQKKQQEELLISLLKKHNYNASINDHVLRFY